MKQPIIKSPDIIKYGYKRLSPGCTSVKDSCSFEFDGWEYMACTNVKDGGLIIFRNVNDTYQTFQKLFTGWGMMWAPCVIKKDGQIFIFCSDTDGLIPFWKTQNIKWFEWIPNQNPSMPKEIKFDSLKGRIDPEIVKIGDTYVMFYVVMDWNNGEWWDVYYSISTDLLGPYIGEWNISQMVETGIEEAPHVIGDKLYWSVGDSEVNSHMRRGDLVSHNDVMNVVEDIDFRIGVVNSDICTHPDSFNGKIRATTKIGREFAIIEVLK